MSAKRKLKNAKSLPEVYYGLHMVEGVAEYQESGSQPFRILVGEDAIKNMNPSFTGKPVYVDHVDEVDLENIQNTADGYVIESKYNPADGKNWVKFIVITDRAKEAIRMGWKLSNAYIPKGFAGGGLWHGVEYAKEVTSGEYEHLAIVRNPRYEESMILTPEAFKAYNGEKELEIARLSNSKEKQEMGLKLFKRAKVENALDFEGVMVELPKSKKEVSLVEAVELADKITNMHGYASGDHMVKVGNDEMSVNDLVKKHMEACNAMDEMKKAKEEEGLKNDEEEEGTIAEGEKDVGSRGGDKSLTNEEDEDKEDAEKEKLKNEADAKKAEIRAKNEKLKNAARRGLGSEEEESPTIETGIDQVNRGKSRYGS